MIKRIPRPGDRPGFPWQTLAVCRLTLLMVIPLASCQTTGTTSTSEPGDATLNRECNWIGRSNGTLWCQVPTATVNLQHVLQLIQQAANTTHNIHRLTLQFVSSANWSDINLNPQRAQSPLVTATNTSENRGLCEIQLLGYPWPVLPVALFHEVADMLTHVTITTDDVSLSVDGNAFGQLRDIVQLNLSGNKIVKFAEREFCEISNLFQLNISRNLFNDSSAMGLDSSCHSPDATSCAADLQVLDVSHNKLGTVVTNSFCSLSNLTSLNLHNNLLKEIKDEAFAGLDSLRRLDLSKNALIRFPRHLWRNTPGITYLNLFYNRLQRLDNQTFEHLSSLQELNINGNKINTVAANTFHKMTNLSVLLLDSNRIFTFTPRTFEAQSRLLRLSLVNNLLESLNGTTFVGLDRLDRLDLNYNVITAVEPDTFSKCCQRMRKLSLHGNQLQSVPKLSSLSSIEVVSLSVNPFVDIPNDAFANLENITEIELDATGLKSLPDDIFHGLVQLESVALTANALMSMSSSMFSSNLNLLNLDLEENKLEGLPDLSNTSLKFLRAMDNSLALLNTSLLPGSLQHLDVSYNRINSISPNGFEKLENLQSINLKNNDIVSVSNFRFPSNVFRIVLANNRITLVNANDFQNATALTWLSLDANRLTTLDSSVLSTLSLIARTHDLSLTIDGNPFTCDCQMAWLKNVDAKNRLLGNLVIRDYQSTKCCVNNIRKPQCHINKLKQLIKIDKVDIEMFLCPFRYNDSFNSKDCPVTSAPAVCHLPCPQLCQCHYKNDRTSIVTVCSSIGLTEVPLNISTNSVAIYLDGNSITSLVHISFKVYVRVEKLFLNGTYLEAISNSTLANMTRLVQLHLEDNLLQALPIGAFDSLQKLEMLNLSGNLLSTLSDGVFHLLGSLTNLQLTNNLLVDLPSVIVRNETLELLGLKGNPWTCNCRNMGIYSQWQQNNILSTVDDQRLLCYKSGSNINIGDKSKRTNFVGNYTAYRVQSNPEDNHQAMKMADYGFLFCAAETMVSVSLPVAIATSLLVLATVASVLIFVYRYEIQVLLYSHCSFRLPNGVAEDNDEGGCDGPLYDAFVAYSNDDELFVAKELLPRLEGPLVPSVPYRLCLHQRDFAVGAFISESIGEAVNRSRRTIVVLSRHFVASSWCRYEFKTAHYQMLQDRRKRVIVIVLTDGGVENIPDGDLDAEMRLYLKTNTYLKWGDHLFWQKLYYAMPRPRNAGVTTNS